MTVNGVGNATDCKRSDSIGGNMQMDSISRNLKNQIANAQKKLQELSSNQELSLEEKMKKRQEDSAGNQQPDTAVKTASD